MEVMALISPWHAAYGGSTLVGFGDRMSPGTRVGSLKSVSLCRCTTGFPTGSSCRGGDGKDLMVFVHE